MSDNQEPSRHLPRPTEAGQVDSDARRDFLKKAGKFALYAPPALMLLTHPSKANALGSALCQYRGLGHCKHGHENKTTGHFTGHKVIDKENNGFITREHD